MKWIFLIVAVIFIPSCEGEKFKYLQKKLEGIEERNEILQKKYEELKAEQQKSWQSGIKERYAWLVKMESESVFTLNRKYVHRITLEYDDKNKDKINACFEFYSQEDKQERPAFYIFFYDEQGLLLGAKNIEYSSINPKWWGKKLKPGKSIEYTESISLLEKKKPTFFRIKTH